MKNRSGVVAVAVQTGLLTWCLATGAGEAAPPAPGKAEGTPTVQQAYPGLASGVLATAKLVRLPKGVLLKGGDLQIKAVDVENEIAKMPEEFQEQLRDSAFFILEKIATSKLLAMDARAAAAKAGKDAANITEDERVESHRRSLAATSQVAYKEVAGFYAANKTAFYGASLDAVKGNIEGHLREQKQQQIVEARVRPRAETPPMQVPSAWVKDKAPTAANTPVDTARRSGKPSLVAFGAASCCGPDRMIPVLERVREAYKEGLNVVHVDVRREQVLAMRYRITSIPAQIYFGKDGTELARYTGFADFGDLQRKLTEPGVQ